MEQKNKLVQMNDRHYEIYTSNSERFQKINHHQSTTINEIYPATHYHNHYEVIFVQDDATVYEVEGKELRFPKGSAFVICPFTIHKRTSGSEAITISLSSKYVEILTRQQAMIQTLFQTLGTLPFLLINPNQRIRKRLEELFPRLIEEAIGEQLNDGYVLNLLIYGILSSLASAITMNDSMRSTDQLYHQFRAYIDEHFTNPALSLEMAAEELFITPSYAARYFKQKTGIPFYQFVTTKRIQVAIQLIENQESVSKIHQKCGFKNYSNFYRMFKQRMGISPKEYQKNFTEKLTSRK